MIPIFINGAEIRAEDGERVIDVINRAGVQLPQVCYHLQLGPIQTAIGCRSVWDCTEATSLATFRSSERRFHSGPSDTDPFWLL